MTLLIFKSPYMWIGVAKTIRVEGGATMYQTVIPVGVVGFQITMQTHLQNNYSRSLRGFLL